MTLSVEKLTRVYVKIRDKRRALAAEFKKQDEALQEELNKIQMALLEYCKEEGVDSVRTASGLAYRTTTTRYWADDWEAMGKFVVENEVPEFFEKRLNQTEVKAWLEEHPDKHPPGLNSTVKYEVRVRK